MTMLARLFSLLLLIAALVMVALILWVQRAPAPSGTLDGRISRIVVEKAARRMVVYDGATALRTYAIALGSDSLGDKVRQGDGRTPEGVFRIDRKNDRSAFTLSLGLDYPQPDDRSRATAGGYDPGGDIMIHGQPNSLGDWAMLKGDWTAGCIALPNEAIREVFAAAEVGTVVEVRP